MARIQPPIRHVALLIEWSRSYGQGILRGIGKYVQAHGRWKVYHTERRLSDLAPSWLRKWQGDGIIARIENPRLAAQVNRLRVPVVNLFDRGDRSPFPLVISDSQAIAHLAAMHLFERDLRYFAYCGLPGIHSSDERCHHFVTWLAAKGRSVQVYEGARPQQQAAFIAGSENNEVQREESLMKWLRGLPKPIGVMACNDLRAHQVLMACDETNLAVPEEVAVIGVDNDEMICGLSRPPLSSIDQNAEEVGYQAAALLDRLMQKELKPPQPNNAVFVKPSGVVTRQSTNVVAIDDADIVSALRYIREHACDGIRVKEVLAHIPLSRRTLERRFTELVGRTPKDEIARVQLTHMKRLLAMTDYSLEKIAQLTGFHYVESMCVLFKQVEGQTPGQYRRGRRA